MKKILLTAVNAKYIHSNLAVYSLRAYARELKENIVLAEYTINNRTEYILREIYLKKPDVICFSCYIWNISIILEVAEEFHKLCPKVPIWVGGPEVSYEVEAFLKEHPFITGVIIGEGEKTFSELCRYYVKGEGSLEEMKGIALFDGAGNVQIHESQEILDMNTIPFCYDLSEDFSHRIIYYESSRGCPFRCSYCLSSVEKILRFRDVEIVKRELQFFLDQKVKQVKFVDRTFNCDKKHAMAIWQYILGHDNGITNFHFEIAADLLTDEEADLIAKMRPGLIQLEIGVQSTNPKTIEEIRRKTSFEKISEKVKKVQEGKNVHQHLDLIAGLPYEGYESFKKSFCDVYALAPEQLQLGFLKLLKGSYMNEKAKDYGCVCKGKEPYEVLGTKWLSYGEICRLKGIEDMVEVYYNSGQFRHTMKAMEGYFSDAFSMYETLADFYEKKGYFGISHSRIRRYEILMEFLEEREVENLSYFKELMILDLYARENLKTRPVWAADRKAYKEKIQEFYTKEAEAPEVLQDYAGYQPKQLEKMTHLEIFSYNVPEGKAEKGSYPVLFDYRNRNPLTNDAAMHVVTL